MAKIRDVTSEKVDHFLRSDGRAGLPAESAKIDASRAEVGRCLADFDQTKQGAYLWRAYAEARRGNIAIPARVLAYFDGIAACIEEGIPPRELSEVMQLTARRGGPTLQTRMRTIQKQRRIIIDLRCLCSGIGEEGAPASKAEAHRLVEKKHQLKVGSAKKLERKWKNWKFLSR